MTTEKKQLIDEKPWLLDKELCEKERQYILDRAKKENDWLWRS